MTWRNYIVTTRIGTRHTVRAVSINDADWRARHRYNIDMRTPYRIEREDDVYVAVTYGSPLEVAAWTARHAS